MLPSLDTRILSALSRDDGDDEELEFDPRGHISLIKTLIAEDSNWSDGMIRLLGLWPKIDPRLYRKKPMSTCHALYHKGGPNNWWIDFHDATFSSLRLRPGSGGIITIYAFGKRVQSFQMIGCRRNWAAMISWIWDYGKKLEAVRLKRKASIPSARAQGQHRRVEKPLPHQVLHTAKFKAHHGRMSKTKDVAVVLGNTDLEMGDVDATKPLYNPTTDTANLSERAGLALKTRGMNDDERMTDATVQGIDFGALKVVDHNS